MRCGPAVVGAGSGEIGSRSAAVMVTRRGLVEAVSLDFATEELEVEFEAAAEAGVDCVAVPFPDPQAASTPLSARAARIAVAARRDEAPTAAVSNARGALFPTRCRHHPDAVSGESASALPSLG